MHKCFHQYAFLYTKLLVSSFYISPWEINLFTVFHNCKIKNRYLLASL